MTRAEQYEFVLLLTTAALRVSGVVFVLASFYPLTSWIIEGVSDRDFFWFDYYWPRIFSSALLVLFGVVFTLCAGPIARRLIRFGLVKCPRCRYRLEGTPVDRCPECGLYLGPNFMDPPASVTPTDDEPAA